jgi:pyruvate,water dikinase
VADQEKKIVKGSGGGVKWVPVAKADREKQKLTGKQIVELAKICAGIEKHYKFPCDIEWAYMKGKFYITQSRPITTL